MASSRLWCMFLFISTTGLRLGFCSQVYVVYMGGKTDETPEEVLRKNQELLMAVHGGSGEKARESHVYSYSNSFRGFAAKLSESQATAMSGMPDVVSVFPNRIRRLHTTHSWDFIGLTIDDVMEISTKNQENVIIGFIDTGIWPESPSFRDDRMSPVPNRWKGICQTGKSSSNFSCNRKIIGARYYSSGFTSEMKITDSTSSEFNSPRDSSGHGSHTASIAAGRLVVNVDFDGLGAGGARGGAPLARIAVYKACWTSGCYDADILAAFDDAIKDGVDLLSLSLGPDPPQGSYFSDAISIGSFHAVSRGILVVSSVGNFGVNGSATNLAPWMLTVGAGSTDREFVSNILLGDGTRIMGESLNVMRMNASSMIIPASHANAGYFTPYQASFCLESSLDKEKARGKILVCRHSGSSSESKLAKGMAVKNAGGVGMILIDEINADVATPFIIPAAAVGKVAGEKILSYVNSTRKPSGLIFPARTVIGSSKSAPRVAAFSSKGPNALTPEILKPDVAAPGLNILAAWSPAAKGMKSNVLSGTSMACPHVTGIAALVKSLNPSWSPAAIKSTIMTTASVVDNHGGEVKVEPDGRVANPFDHGSGFLNSARVLNPGLIYDSDPEELYDFLCAVGYDDKTRRLVNGKDKSCPKSAHLVQNLNYPAISVVDLRGSTTVFRTLTNVGNPRSIYSATVYSPPGVNVRVEPEVLVFSGNGEKVTFTVNFTVIDQPLKKGYSFGSLSWISGNTAVRSPIIVQVASK